MNPTRFEMMRSDPNCLWPGELVCHSTGLVRCLTGQAAYVVSRGEVYRGCFFLRFPLDV